MGLGHVVQSILDGEIRPCIMKASRGLGGLLFYDSDIAKYQRELNRKTIDDAVRVGEAARLLGLQKTTVYQFIRRGILTANKVTIGNRQTLFVTTKSIDRFSVEYVLPARLAPRLRTVSVYLTRLLIAEGVQPVTGPVIDKEKCYVFRKRDLEKIDLEALINKERQRHRSRTLSPLVNLNEASRLLGISRDLIQVYVENGILKQHKYLSHFSSNKGDFCFSRYAIENFRAQAIDFHGLVSAKVAAAMLNKCVRSFYIKYVRTGRLKKALYGGKRGEQYFRRKEVETIVELEKEEIDSQGVAEILKVSMSSIYRMTVSKELKPISGPLVDGYHVNLFLRSDIEELKASRAAFREECVRVGKTTRFGKPSDNRSCPVQEKVMYRIKQLLEEWLSQPRLKRRISRLALHRQLVKEGYKVGTTTVYKMLHGQLEQSYTV
jgi:excisionase family DNA binding protein